MAATLLVLGTLAACSGAAAALWLVTRPLPPRGWGGVVVGWTLGGLLLLLVGVALWGWQ